MLHRRHFLAAAAGSIAGFHILPRSVVAGAEQTPPSEKLNIAGHRRRRPGRRRAAAAGRAGQNIVALCDVDGKYAAHTFKTYPKAETLQGLPRHAGQAHATSTR